MIGAGVNKTFVVACGSPSSGSASSGRRGFILGNHSYLGHFTWQGLQKKGGNFDAAVGTPHVIITCIIIQNHAPLARFQNRSLCI